MKTLKTLIVLILSIGFLNTAYAEQGDEQSTTIGSVLGSATGALIGYQFGGGHGKYATTAAGAVAGYVLGGKFQENLNKEPEYQPVYGYQSSSYQSNDYPNNGYQSQYNRPVYVGKDDYLIKQQQSDARKRRNMIRNGERDPLEMPYDTSEVQTSWDDPFN